MLYTFIKTYTLSKQREAFFYDNVTLHFDNGSSTLHKKRKIVTLIFIWAKLKHLLPKPNISVPTANI